VKGERPELAMKVTSTETEAITVAKRLLAGTDWIQEPKRIGRVQTDADHDETSKNDAVYRVGVGK
jgi:hypothetical protein